MTTGADFDGGTIFMGPEVDVGRQVLDSFALAKAGKLGADKARGSRGSRGGCGPGAKPRMERGM